MNLNNQINEKTIEALKLRVQSESTDERINHMLQMLEKAEEQTKSLCDLALPLPNSQKEAGIRGREYGVLGGPSGALGARNRYVF